LITNIEGLIRDVDRGPLVVDEESAYSLASIKCLHDLGRSLPMGSRTQARFPPDTLRHSSKRQLSRQFGDLHWTIRVNPRFSTRSRLTHPTLLAHFPPIENADAR